MLLRISDYLSGCGEDCFTARQLVYARLRRATERNPPPSVCTIVLHGSYATGAITEFSDIDIAVITPVELPAPLALQLRRTISKLEFLTHRLDPTMHHGVQCITPKQLHAYDESMLPLAALNRGSRIFGPSEIWVTSDSNKSEREARAKAVRKAKALLKVEDSLLLRTPYKLKGLISVVLLLSCLVTQADGRGFLYKPDALKVFYREYSGMFPTEAIEVATELRASWRRSRVGALVRQLLTPLEHAPVDPLLLQRTSGLFFPHRRQTVTDFASACREFAMEVLKYLGHH